MEKHLKHLRYLEAKLEKAEPQSNDWWTIKGQLEQVRIAYSQAFNLAVEANKNYMDFFPDEKMQEKEERMKIYIRMWQSYFYDKLTEPLSILINEKKTK